MRAFLTELKIPTKEEDKLEVWKISLEKTLPGQEKDQLLVIYNWIYVLSFSYEIWLNIQWVNMEPCPIVTHCNQFPSQVRTGDLL